MRGAGGLAGFCSAIALGALENLSLYALPLDLKPGRMWKSIAPAPGHRFARSRRVARARGAISARAAILDAIGPGCRLQCATWQGNRLPAAGTVSDRERR
jgi:hypothetical protein